MKVKKWHVVDIYYHDWETPLADKAIKRLKRQGYSLEHQDSDPDYDNCDQLIKWL